MTEDVKKLIERLEHLAKHCDEEADKETKVYARGYGRGSASAYYMVIRELQQILGSESNGEH